MSDYHGRHFLSWYNRGGRKFNNGITWVRFGGLVGLWWKDTRVASPDKEVDYEGPKLKVGPYLVAILGRRDG